MRRFFHILLIGIAALIVVAIAGVLVLTRTAPGRHVVKGEIEKIASNALGGPVIIETLEGNLLREFSVRGALLADEDGEWLQVSEANVRWRPLALLKRNLQIDRLEIDGANFTRRPEYADDTNEEPDDKPLSLPTRIPDFNIAALQLSDARIALGDATYRLDGAGVAETRGNRLYLRLEATSEGDRDIVDLALDYAPQMDRLFVDVTIASRGGLIANVAGLGGPVFLELRGDSPLDEIALALDTQLGEIGAVNGAIRAALAPQERGAFDFTFIPGARFDGVTELSQPVSGRVSLARGDRQGTVDLTIENLILRAGAVDASARLIFADGALIEFAGAGHVAAAEDYRPEITAYSGRGADVQFEGALQGNARLITAEIVTDRLSIATDKAQTDFTSRFSGPLRIKSAPIDAMPPVLADGFEAIAAVNMPGDGPFEIASLTLEAQGATLHASGDFDTQTRRVNARGDLVMRAAAISELAGGIRPRGEASADFDISGSLDNFTLAAGIDAPGATLAERETPPFTGAVTLAGLPTRPTGDVRLTAAAPARGALEATLRSSAEGEIALTKLDYTTPLFYLRGSGEYAPATKTASIDLAYSGGADAAPWPGVNIEGDASVKGSISADGALNDLTLDAPALAFNSYRADELRASLSGPPGAASLNLSAQHLAGLPLGEADEVNLAAQIDLTDSARSTITRLDAIVAGNRLTLTAPMELAFAPTITIGNARFSYGRSGRIAFDAMMSKGRWNADLELSDVNLPQTDGRASLTLALDTASTPLASGAFTLRSLIAEENLPPVQGNVVWDGNTLLITSAGDSPLSLDVSAPVSLHRDDGLRISMQGALAGTIGFDGRAEMLTAFAPPELQSFTGDVTANFELGGDMARPTLAGKMALSNGQYTELETGLALAGIHLEADASYETGGESRLALRGGARGPKQTRDDTIKLDGEFDLAQRSLTLTATLDGAEFAAYPVDAVRASGGLTVNGAIDNLEARGEIKINELNAEIAAPEDTGLVPIEVVAYNETAQASADDETAPASIDYEISIAADNRIFIRGRGLESEWSANVTAESTDAGGLILGKLSLRRGWLDFSGRRFEFARGEITFDRLSPNDPALDMRAEYQTTEGVTAIIAVGGRASSPNISLQSTPERPSEDVMALVLFGKPAQDLSPLESLQTAQALASLGGIGPFGGQGVTGRLRQAIGLDLLNIDIDPENGGGSLTVGKYVADGFFVSATQDAQGEGGSVRVKYEITDRITIETEIEQTGDQTVSANWSKDF